MADPIFGRNKIQLKIGSGGETPTYTKLADVREIVPPSISASTEDVTSHDSPGRYVQKAVTTVEVGDIEVTVNYDAADTVQTALIENQ